MINEIWKDLPVEPYNTRYEVSSNGKIRSKIFYDRINRKRGGRELKLTKDKYGYVRIRLSLNYKKASFRIHRLVALAFIENDNCKNFNMVNHIDGNKSNNNVNNLEWTDNRNNIIHAINNNLITYKTGENARSSKYITIATNLKNESQVIKMCGNKEMRDNGFDPRLVHKCIKGERFSHAGYSFKRYNINE